MKWNRHGVVTSHSTWNAFSAKIIRRLKFYKSTFWISISGLLDEVAANFQTSCACFTGLYWLVRFFIYIYYHVMYLYSYEFICSSICFLDRCSDYNRLVQTAMKFAFGVWAKTDCLWDTPQPWDLFDTKPYVLGIRNELQLAVLF
jgi:hypothetical protein